MHIKLRHSAYTHYSKHVQIFYLLFYATLKMASLLAQHYFVST